jgi:hypothetical protein
MVGDAGDLQERMQRTMPPELTSPVAVWLTHESCSLNGEVLHGGSGRASRVFMGETPGFVNTSLTLEDVATNQDKILREDGYFVFESGYQSSEVQTKLVEAAGPQ